MRRDQDPDDSESTHLAARVEGGGGEPNTKENNHARPMYTFTIDSHTVPFAALYQSANSDPQSTQPLSGLSSIACLSFAECVLTFFTDCIQIAGSFHFLPLLFLSFPPSSPSSPPPPPPPSDPTFSAPY